MFISIYFFGVCFTDCSFCRDELVTSSRAKRANSAISYPFFVQRAYFHPWHLMDTVPVAFTKPPTVFLYAPWAKAEPLRKRYMAGHKTCAHMNRWAIAT